MRITLPTRKAEEPPGGGSCTTKLSIRVNWQRDQPPIRAVPECPSFRSHCTVDPFRVSL
jgi:hypothetical protein